MPFPKWKYRIDPDVANRVLATLVGTQEAEAELGAEWADDPLSLRADLVPCGGPWDASGRVAFGPPPAAPGIVTASIGL